MLNAEKYRDEILEFISKKGTMHFSFKKDNVNKFGQCCETNCDYCSLYSENSTKEPCTIKRIKWLLSEYKEPIKLSKVEYEILRYLYKRDYRYITREKSERVIAFKGRPHKRDYDAWNTISGEKIGYLDLYDFSNLFQFTNWEDSEPTSIKDILKNCEVIEDANY